MKKYLVLFIFGLIFAFTQPGYAADNMKSLIVVVDPGHGGYDPGTVKNGISEKEINLQVSNKIKKLLENYGAKVILTRKSDNSLIDYEKSGKCQKEELQKRLDIAEKNNANLFISIHVNSVGLESCNGPEVFYNSQNHNSQMLAGLVQKELLTVPHIGQRTEKASDYYVLLNSNCDSILIELGYLSNFNERNKLINSDYQQLLAKKIVNGIYRYYSNSE